MAIYSWNITFDDLTDEAIKKLGENYFIQKPSITTNYYSLTAQKFISFINSFGVTAEMISNFDRDTNPPHYMVTQWLVTCMQMLICQNLSGVNDVDIKYDKYNIKYKMYRDDLKNISGNLSYETIVTATMQQNYTRAGNTFRIMA